MFQMFSKRRERVRRPSGSDPFAPKYTSKTVKHPESVMVWDCFSGLMGRGGLYFLSKNATMNGDCYIECLKDHLLLPYEIHGTSIFMHDKAPCYMSNKVKTFLAEKGIEVLEWCGNSPDLNPIKNAWKHMKSKLRIANLTSLPELKKEIKRVWIQEMDIQYFENLGAKSQIALRGS